MDVDRLRLTSLANGGNTRFLIVQTSHEGDRVAIKVRLVVEGTLREDGSLTGVEGVGDESDTVFENETNFKVGSCQHVQEFGGAWVIVRRGQSARPIYVKDGLDRWGQIGDRKHTPVYRQ